MHVNCMFCASEDTNSQKAVLLHFLDDWFYDQFTFTLILMLYFRQCGVLVTEELAAINTTNCNSFISKVNP